MYADRSAGTSTDKFFLLLSEVDKDNGTAADGLELSPLDLSAVMMSVLLLVLRAAASRWSDG